MPSKAELSTVVALVHTHRAVLVNVGHGRDPGSIARADAFIEEWRASGGEIGVLVSWPAVAGFDATEGLRGAFTDGTAWAFQDGLLVTCPEMGPPGSRRS